MSLNQFRDINPNISNFVWIECASQDLSLDQNSYIGKDIIDMIYSYFTIKILACYYNIERFHVSTKAKQQLTDFCLCQEDLTISIDFWNIWGCGNDASIHGVTIESNYHYHKVLFKLVFIMLG